MELQQVIQEVLVEVVLVEVELHSTDLPELHDKHTK